MGEYRLADPEHALKTEIHYQRLVDLDPALGMRGAGHRDVELIYALHELRGTEPDWEAIGKGDLGFTVGLLKSLGKQAKDTVEGAAVLVHGVLVKLPVELVLGIANLVRDPKGSVESVGENVEDIIAGIQALPQYVEQASAEIKTYLDNINSLEDPYEQGEALGKFMGNVLPTAVVAGSLGKGGKAAKGFSKVQRGVKGMSKGVGRGVSKANNHTAKNSSNILGWSKNSEGHLIKHANTLGFTNKTPQQLQRMLPELRSAANKLLNEADPTLTRIGQWHQFPSAIMRISNGKMLVTQSDGTFITVINKTSNNWYQRANPLR